MWSFVSPNCRRRSQTAGDCLGAESSSSGWRGSPEDQQWAHHRCQRNFHSESPSPLEHKKLTKSACPSKCVYCYRDRVSDYRLIPSFYLGTGPASLKLSRDPGSHWLQIQEENSRSGTDEAQKKFIGKTVSLYICDHTCICTHLVHFCMTKKLKN